MDNAEFAHNITQAFTLLKNQDPLFQPTAFWADASEKLAADIVDSGIGNFRQASSALGYFVPTYGMPFNGHTEQSIAALHSALSAPVQSKISVALHRFLSGYEHALADYRVLMAAETLDTQSPYLQHFSESTFGNPKEHFEFNQQLFSRSALNYLLGLAFLKKHVDTNALKTVLEIGGGYGSLGEIVAKTGAAPIKYIDIDIPPTSCVAYAYLAAVFGTDKVANGLALTAQTQLAIAALPQLSVLNSWQITQLEGEIDLFVNFISFQEMEPAVVLNYLKHVKRLKPKWILLRNLREGKQIKKDHQPGVEIPILADDYIAMLDGYKLLARQVWPFAYQTVDGFHSELLLFTLS